MITIEIVGELLGRDCDKNIGEYFKFPWNHFFPHIPDRTNFIRQAPNLHVVKRLLQEKLVKSLGSLTDTLYLIDGMPMPICRFARAYFSQVFKGQAAYGYCATKKEHYYGFRGIIVMSSIGVIAGGTFAAANIDERDISLELVDRIRGLMLGDKEFMRPLMQEVFAERGLYLQTPLREDMKDDRERWFLKWMKSTWRLIETVIGQLTERFHIERVRVDQWFRLWT